MKFFKCGKCDKILEKKYANNHPKSAITWFNADESDEKEKKVDDIANEDKDKKKEDEARKAEEHDKEELRKLSSEELDQLKADLEQEIEKLRPKKETKEAQRKRYDVLDYRQYDSVIYSGDELLKNCGSTD